MNYFTYLDIGKIAGRFYHESGICDRSQFDKRWQQAYARMRCRFGEI